MQDGSPIPVKWIKNTTNGEYFDLLKLDLSTSYFNGKNGIYLIWYASPRPKVIRVGQGPIGERLSAHRSDPAFRSFAAYGPLKVTWVTVAKGSRDGIEAYLYDYYKPVLGDRPEADPIPVTPLI